MAISSYISIPLHVTAYISRVGVSTAKAKSSSENGAETKDHQFPDGTGGEHMIVNVWRPLYDKVPNWGLAVMDGSSLAQGDVHPTILNSFDNNPGGRTKGDLSVVNVNASGCAYIIGFNHPKLLLPADIRASFNNATTAAKLGAEQDVPETGTSTINCVKAKFSAFIATSG